METKCQPKIELLNKCPQRRPPRTLAIGVLFVCALFFYTQWQTKNAIAKSYPKVNCPVVKCPKVECPKLKCPNTTKLEKPPPKLKKSDDFKFDDLCYKFANKNSTPIKLFEDILKSNKKPVNGTAIFFIETSCARNGTVLLNARYGF